jgi:hypothetical protein
MPDQEEEIVRLEEQFPALAGAAFAAARAEALAAGESVLQSEGGAIYEIFPDGTRKWVKDIEPPTRVVRGAKITIR